MLAESKEFIYPRQHDQERITIKLLLVSFGRVEKFVLSTWMQAR